MTDFQAIADRVEIEALRGEFTDAAMMRDRARLASLLPLAACCGCPAFPSSWPARRRSVPGASGCRTSGSFSCRTRTRARSSWTATRATGRAYMQELARTRDGRQGLNYAIYHDRYQRTGDGWRFTERVYEVRYLDTSPLAGSAPHPAGAPAGPPAGNMPPEEGRR